MVVVVVETVVIENLRIHDVVLELPQGPVHLLGHPVRPHDDVAYCKKINKSLRCLTTVCRRLGAIERQETMIIQSI